MNSQQVARTIMGLEETNDIGALEGSELDDLLAGVMSQLDRNEPVDWDELISSHPQHAREIENFFSVSHELDEMVRMSASRVVSSEVDQAQRSTTSIDSQTVPMLKNLPPLDSPAPRKIGKYEILDLLGAGSFGKVYLGYDPLAKRKVAIKVPRSWSEVTREQREAFLHEAQSAASLRHEHIVTLLDVYQGSDVPIALIYEHIDGPTMQTVFKQQAFDRVQAIGWIAKIADALSYAHRKGVVHRDVKPSNVLLADGGEQLQPRIVDFGLALLHDRFWRKGDRSRVGAIRYMSPEQASSNSHWATAQSDVFSLGVVLYEVLCGRSPWTGATDVEMLREIEQRNPAPPRVMDSSISPALERICLKALAKSPAERYTTAADMARDLRDAIRTRESRWTDAKTLIAAAAVILLAVVGTFAVSTSKDAGSAAHAVATTPNVPVVETIAPQEVRLNLQIQPQGKLGAALDVNDELERLQLNDRLQINAQVPQRGYLYVVWYRPDGEVRLLDEKALDTPQIAVQEPPVDKNAAWEPLDSYGAGTHLVVAFTKPRPLSSDEVKQLKSASWQSATDWLGDHSIFRTGHPRTVTDGPTRGTPAPPKVVDNDRYLGDLGTLLKYRWGCYYQAIIFRVN